MIRGTLFAAGVLALGYGAVLLLSRGWANLAAATVWLVGGVVLHDAVLAPAVLLASYVAVRVAAPRRLAPWAVALVVLGPVTLLGIPVLGRFGARPDNPTLLDRHYWWGWAALVVVVSGAILVGTWVGRLRASAPSAGGGGDGARAGRR